MASVTAICILIVLGVLVLRRWLRRRALGRLPPGPTGYPVVGNAYDLPPKGIPEFQHWQKHRETYGPISSVSVMGQTIILIHDREVAHELMGKQSLKTAGRPQTEFGTGMCGFGELLPIQQYNHDFRLARKLMQQQLGTKGVVSQFDELQTNEVRKFLGRVAKDPETIFEEFETLIAATVLKMTYGYSMTPSKTDPLVELARRMVHNMDRSLQPGAWLVDMMPILKYLPEWFPGAGFKQTAVQWKALKEETLNIPYSFVRQLMSKGDHYPSYVSKLVQQCSDGKSGSKLGNSDENAIKSSAAVMFLGASDTVPSSLRSFVNAMIMFPEVQHKAQAELDRVVGKGRLPQFEDRDQLPYIDALVKEVHRWSPVAPMGLPHTAVEDIYWNGYRIPQGSFVMPSIWWFCHDPDVYTDPDSFCPDRFMEPRNEPDPKTVVFGYGRRLCPGRHFADSSMFLVIAQMLAVFDIGKKDDRNTAGKGAIGNGIHVDHGSGAININHLVGCKVDITLRDAKAEDILVDTNIAAGKEEDDHARLLASAIDSMHN